MQSPMNKLPMTAGGHSALENELTNRIRIERPRLIQRIREAIADDSNLAENSEYQAAKAEQEINEARIAELEDKLARSEIIDGSPAIRSNLGPKIRNTRPPRQSKRSTRPVLPNWKISSRVLKSLMYLSSPAIRSNLGPR
jgi:transcription elongation factor-like protein